MLKMSPAVTVNDVPSALGPMDYILYPDSEEKDVYYALAERPTFQAIGGKPAFNLTWYYGDGQTAGGICTFTVALPMPDLKDEKANAAISAALNGDSATVSRAKSILALCQAKAGNDAATVATLKAKLGFDDATVDRTAAAYDKDRDYTQFMPRVTPDKIKPIPFKSGAVTVQAFANAQAYQSGTAAFASGTVSTTPSLLNGNAAVVTFNLQDLGANLFWHGLGGPAFKAGETKPKEYDAKAGGVSVIAVTYGVTFDGLLPAAQATVTLRKEIVAQLDVEQQVRSGSWGRRWTENIVRGKKYEQAIDSATEVVLPGGGTKEENDAVRKLLTDWAGKQLEDMVKSQMPEVKLDELNADSLRKIENLDTQSRTYKLTQGVTLPRNPQGQLQKISGLVPAKDLDQYFQNIDLNDKPYFNVDVTVNSPSPSLLKAKGVRQVALTDIRYIKTDLFDKTNKPVTTLVFKPTADAAGDDLRLRGTFDARTPEADRTLSYGYTVSYDDGTPSLKVSGAALRGTNYLDIGSIDLGVLQVTLRGDDLPWGVLDRASVDLTCGKWTKRVSLKEDAEVAVAKPFGREIVDPLTYVATLTLKSGDVIKGRAVEVALNGGSADVFVQSPIGNKTCTVTLQRGSGVTSASVAVRYTFRSRDADRIIEDVIDLDESTPRVAWKVPTVPGHKSSFCVTKAIVDDEQLADIKGGEVEGLQGPVSIRVGPKGILSI